MFTKTSVRSAAYKYVHDIDLASDMVHDSMVNLAKTSNELKVDKI